MTMNSIVHPADPTLRAEYGFDHALGFFVTLREGRQKFEYDAIRPGYRDLEGALQFFVTHAFFTEEDLEDGKRLWADEALDDAGPLAQVALEIISRFKANADG